MEALDRKQGIDKSQLYWRHLVNHIAIAWTLYGNFHAFLYVLVEEGLNVVINSVLITTVSIKK